MAKKRIPEVPRDGSEVDFIPENFMLIDGAEGSAKMRMDLFGKESSIEELDEVKYEKPEDGIPKTDLAVGVQDSLGLADTALQASDIEGKANKSEMIISAVTGDTTKKNIQLKNGLIQTVVVEHQDVTGKADKSEMTITDVSGDITKKTIQLKNNLSQTVLVEHQDISGKVSSDEMRITDVSGDNTKKTIQLKTGLSQDVVVAHQDISEKVGRNEMAVIEVIGDTTKRSIQLNSQLSQDVIVAHQDVSGKANQSEMLISAVPGDDTKKTIQLKSGVSQDVVVDISGKADAEDVLTTWTRARENPSQVTGTLSLNSTVDPTRIEVNLDNTIAGDLLVGHLVPKVINDDRGKVLMVTQTTGIAWQPLPLTELQEYPGSQSAHTVQGTLGFITDSGPKRTSAYLAVTDSDPTCLGMLVPPVKSEDAGRILTVDVDDGPVWRDPPRTDTEWDKLNPYTQEFGVLKFVTSFNEEETNVWVNHHTSAYIGTVDVSGWVGEFLPHYETSDAGKILMVSPTRGPEWVNMPGLETTWKYGDSETRQGTLSVGTTLEYDSEEQAYYPHHSSAYIEYNSSTTWLGAFVPPTDIGDAGKFLMVDPTNGVEWKSVDYQPRLTAGDNITIDWQNTISAAVPIDFWYTQNYESEVSQTLDGGFYDDSLDIPVPDAIAYGQVKCFIHFAVCVSDLTAPTHLTVRFDNRLSTIADGTHDGQFSPEPQEHSSMFTQHTVDGEVAYFTDCLYAYSSNSNITDHWHCVLHYDAPSGSRVGTVVKIKYCVLCAMGKRFDSRTIGDIRNAWPSNTI